MRKAFCWFESVLLMTARQDPSRKSWWSVFAGIFLPLLTFVRNGGPKSRPGGLKMVTSASPRFLRPSLIAMAALAAAVTLAPQAAEARGSSGHGGGGGHSGGSSHSGGASRSSGGSRVSSSHGGGWRSGGSHGGGWHGGVYRRGGSGYYPYGWGWGWDPFYSSWWWGD